MAEHKDHYSHYCNHECEYFPCHKVPEGFDFNCLFCYCPLYALGDKCGGNFKWGLGGLKDCSECLVPHGPNGSSRADFLSAFDSWGGESVRYSFGDILFASSGKKYAKNAA